MATTRAVRVTRAVLGRHPLPRPSGDDDKNSRGIVLVVAGGPSVPGAALLSGVAALRSGAGKLQLATDRRIATSLGLAVPEALVMPLTEARLSAALRDAASRADAVLVGPGMPSERIATALARRVAKVMRPDAVLILDAAALGAAGARDRTVITPHAGEMATLLGISREDVEDEPLAVARSAAERFGCVVALKGARTFVVGGESAFMYADGDVGLATSGSGDALAGVVAGLAGRGADPLTAALWSVWAHGTAGRRLARRVAPLGFLARELLAELPPLVC